MRGPDTHRLFLPPAPGLMATLAPSAPFSDGGAGPARHLPPALLVQERERGEGGRKGLHELRLHLRQAFCPRSLPLSSRAARWGRLAPLRAARLPPPPPPGARRPRDLFPGPAGGGGAQAERPPPSRCAHGAPPPLGAALACPSRGKRGEGSGDCRARSRQPAALYHTSEPTVTRGSPNCLRRAAGVISGCWS